MSLTEPDEITEMIFRDFESFEINFHLEAIQEDPRLDKLLH